MATSGKSTTEKCFEKLSIDPYALGMSEHLMQNCSSVFIFFFWGGTDYKGGSILYLTHRKTNHSS